MNLFPKFKPRPKKLICKRCGHRVGMVKPRLAFNMKIIGAALGIALVIEIIAQLVSDMILK